MPDSQVLMAFERLLAKVSGPAQLRRVLAGESAAPIWNEFVASGFLDLIVPEIAHGAGLALSDLAVLAERLGYALVPLAVAETMVARALLAFVGNPAFTPPANLLATPILLVPARDRDAPQMLATTARLAILQDKGSLELVRVSLRPGTSPLPGFDPLACELRIDATLCRWASPAIDFEALVSALATAQMAGTARRILDMSVEHAGTRVQFGKPIARQQAIQQQLAVMAEHVASLRTASAFACRTPLSAPLAVNALAVAAGKTVASNAVAKIAAIAHAVHGAIGLTAEHDLQLATRRLHGWRLAAGGAERWAARLGRERFARQQNNSLDFLRDCASADRQPMS